MNKECKTCGNTATDGNFCKQCRTEQASNYLRSKEGLPTAIYKRQKSSSKKRGHIKPEYSLAELKEWIFNNPLYSKLHEEWEQSGYARWLTPSINRLRDDEHYNMKNIELMTWQQNSDIDRERRKAGLSGRQHKRVIQKSLNGNVVKTHISISQAARELNISSASISNACRRTNNIAGDFMWEYADVS